MSVGRTQVGIKLGIALGGGEVAAAKRTTAVGVGITAVVLVFLAAAVYLYPRQLGSIFSEDPVVLDLFQEIRVPLVWMMVRMPYEL